MTRLASHVRWLIAVLWVGSVWTVGYVVAPTLFATLQDRTLAGSIAGSMFRVEAWLSIVCGLVLVGLIGFTGRGANALPRRRTLLIVIAAMLACTAISHFGIQPFMAALRASAGGILAGDAKSQFGMLHGLSSVLYLLQSLLGIALILGIRD